MVFLWYKNGMKTTIDRAGRVVIPKSLRQRAGLEPGMELEINLRDGQIEIAPPPPQGRLVREDGLLVWESAPGTPPITTEDINEAIRQVREDREDEIIRGAG
jgi:AbrB family looped-hinge helix DNA binding protein